MPSFAARLKKSSRTRSQFRAQGDKARDQQAWSEAANHYRNHLLLAPDDAAIWVQLGHMLKEEGKWHEAVTAYRRAGDFLPNDHDLLFHLGHTLLAAGDVQNGMERLRESVAAGSTQAAQDLARMGEVSVPNQVSRTSQVSQKLLDTLTKKAKALEATDCCDVKILSNNRLQTLSHDPWIVFEWEDDACPATPLALLTIQTTAMGPDIQPLAQVYADIGDGFSERHSTRFSFSNGRALVLLIEPERIKRIRFDPDQTKNLMAVPELAIARIDSMDEVEQLVRQNSPSDIDIDRLLELLHAVHAGENDQPRPLSPVIALDFELGRSLDFSHDYDYWLSLNASPDKNDYLRMAEIDGSFRIRPRFSFVMPTYNTPIELLRQCIDSLLAQTYGDFEICVADDNSPNRAVADLLEGYAEKDKRVKFTRRKTNGHISAASNTAISLATGEYVVLVDHDDLIPDYALFIVAYYINLYPEADILFSDEDKVTVTGQRVQPYFKSCFNKYLMYGHNMVSHLGVYRRDLVEKVGGFRLGLEGSQDYDLLLRCYELTRSDRIIHIPHILYHWRIIPGSTAMSADQKGYAVVAAQNAINGHFERQNIPLRSVEGFAPGCTGVRPSRTFDTSVSIIIPTRNGLDVLQPCVESIFARDHENAEVIVVDNGSDEPETLTYLQSIAQQDNVRVLKDPESFNFSRINNVAAAAARGDILCFLNNDTEVISADWLNRARTFLSIEEIGMVGARLLFPDGTLQHFGIALGMGEHKIAGVPHLGIDAALPGYFGKARLLQEVSAVTAACMFVRKIDFDAVGGFEENLRVAYNDVDLCLKIRALGRTILADPDITLIHKESRTRGSDKHGERARRLTEEANWMRERWASELDNDPYYSPNIDLGRVDFAYAAKSRRPWPWEVEKVNLL